MFKEVLYVDPSRSANWAGKMSFLNDSVVGLTGDSHFEIEKKYIHRSRPNRS